MRMIDLIQKKKNGGVFTKDEIDYIVKGYTDGDIPDYQMSALLMAICFQGMNKAEISHLTMAYVNSGDIIDLSAIEGIIVDKHSTGGVGDKVSLIVLPLVASTGVPVAKMSGRGLGHTGGTIDKLESIPGFGIELSEAEFIANVNHYKMAIAGQSANLTPADKRIYALRDVTATVDSIPLIASSVMSKKIASGADSIVLDVKMGSGAFMKSLDAARELAHTMVEIGKSLNRQTIAVITDMSQPLGYEVGNANEVKEAIDVLKGRGAEDITAVSLTIASYMTILGGAFPDFNTAYKELQAVISSGEAVRKLKQLVKIQGGDPEVIDNPDQLLMARNHIEIKALKSGYINSIEAESIGIAAMLLGAGRKTKEDKIDHCAGITLAKKVGDKVRKGENLCVLHTNRDDYQNSQNIASHAFTISDIKPQSITFVHDVIQ
ncbi:MAG: pyrimidine-nucleoside phosphorylase [Syntrophomonadaceae bacterium]